MTGREGSLLLEEALVLQSEDWGSSCVEVGRLLPLGLIFLIRNMGLPLSRVVGGAGAHARQRPLLRFSGPEKLLGRASSGLRVWQVQGGGGGMKVRPACSRHPTRHPSFGHWPCGARGSRAVGFNWNKQAVLGWRVVSRREGPAGFQMQAGLPRGDPGGLITGSDSSAPCSRPRKR